MAFQQAQPCLPGEVEGLLRGGDRRFVITKSGLVLGKPGERDCFTLPVAGLGRELKRLLMVPECCRQIPGLPGRRAERVAPISLWMASFRARCATASATLPVSSSTLPRLTRLVASPPRPAVAR